jgi:molybdopterin-binding protein
MRSNAQVTIDAGFVVKTRVSLNSIKNLDMHIGDKINLNFNASALNVFADSDNE